MDNSLWSVHTKHYSLTLGNFAVIFESFSNRILSNHLTSNKHGNLSVTVAPFFIYFLSFFFFWPYFWTKFLLSGRKKKKATLKQKSQIESELNPLYDAFLDLYYRDVSFSNYPFLTCIKAK